MKQERIRFIDLAKYIHKSNALIFKWRKSYIFGSIIFNAILGVLPVSSTLIMQQILNTLQSNTININALRTYIVSYLVVEVIIVVINYSYTYLSNKSIRIINKNMQLTILDKSANLSLGDYEDSDTHNLLTRAQNGANTITTFISGYFTVFRVVVSGISSIIILSKYNLYYIIIILIVPIFEYLFVFRMSRLQYLIRKKRTSKERSVWYLSHIVKTGISLKEIKTFGLIDHWLKRVDRLSSEMIDEDLTVTKKSVWGQSLLAICEVIISGFVFSRIIIDGLEGKILIGDVITYNRLIFGIKGNVESIFSTVEKMLKDALDVSNYYEFLEIKPEKNGTHIIDHIDSVQFKNVSFKYKNNDDYTLRDISFCITAGETVALVGTNGSGKSTILKLLLGFYSDYSGSILINGIELREIDKETFYAHISCVFQDFMKYEDTIRENIACSDMAAASNDSKITTALLDAGFDAANTKIFELDSMLGTWFDDGTQLSGGEWQRIALGRAFFKDAELYMFDEPSSALDPRSEDLILENYCKIIKGKIGIVSSHSLIKIGKYINRIIVMDKGSIVEDGKHDDLLRKKGVYYTMYKSCTDKY